VNASTLAQGKSSGHNDVVKKIDTRKVDIGWMPVSGMVDIG
jgi:hypothetical protein